MVSEGVDIPRLRVLIYLPNATTELYFRQAIGRIVRKRPGDDITRGYAIIPYFSQFIEYAKRVEDEMPQSMRKDPGKSKFKICPVCESQSPLATKICSVCEHEFVSPAGPRMIECAKCKRLTNVSSGRCNYCGHKHNPSYILSFEETLKRRDGYIVQGHEIDEKDADTADTVGSYVEGRIIDSRDPHLINILKKVPKEQFSKLAEIIEDARKMNDK